MGIKETMAYAQQKRLEAIAQQMADMNFTKAELISIAALALDQANGGNLLVSTTTLYAVKGVMAGRKEKDGASPATEL